MSRDMFVLLFFRKNLFSLLSYVYQIIGFVVSLDIYKKDSSKLLLSPRLPLLGLEENQVT